MINRGGNIIMKNNMLKKANLVLSFFLMITSLIVCQGQNVVVEKSITPNKVEKGEYIEEVPFMATAEIADDAIEVAMTDYEEMNSSVYDAAKVSIAFEGDEIYFPIEVIDNFSINWGDGNIEGHDGYRSSNPIPVTMKHKYDIPGKYTIKIEEDSLASLDISGIKGIYEVNLKGCEKLEELKCGNTEISKLELVDCKKLKYLACNNTNISVLDLSGSPDLEYLYYGEEVQKIKLNAECKTILKLSGNSETEIEYVEELPKFSLNKSDMTIDLGEEFEKYEFRVTRNNDWYKGIESWYMPNSDWMQANNFEAVRDNKLYVSEIRDTNWDNNKGVTIRETGSEDNAGTRIVVPKYEVEILGKNGLMRKHEFLPLQNVYFSIQASEIKISDVDNLQKEDIKVYQKEEYGVLRFKMPYNDVRIKLDSDIETLIPSTGEIVNFAETLNPGTEFVMDAPGGRIYGEFAKDGSAIKLKCYVGNKEINNILQVTETDDAMISLTDVTELISLVGARYEVNSDNNLLKLIFEGGNNQFYTHIDVKDGNVDLDEFNNFLCFVLQMNPEIKIINISNEKLIEYDNSILIIGNGSYELAEDAKIYMNNVEIRNINKVFDILGIETPNNFTKVIKCNVSFNSDNKIEVLNLFVSGNYEEIYTREVIVKKVKPEVVILSNGEN